ncbi:MAG: 30S ribosomal protein S16 [Phycisphaerales bacterium]
MVRLRLMRLGRQHRPFYRLNAIDQRTRRNGQVIEPLGWYNPMAPQGTQDLELNVERIQYWLSKGAKPSETVRDILAKNDVLSDKAKAEWQADREVARKRVTAKKAGERADAAVAELAKFGEGADIDVAPFEKAAKDAQSEAKAAVSTGKVDVAEAAAGKAEQALADAKKADETAKAKKAAEEAAAAEAEKAEEGEGGEEASES